MTTDTVLAVIHHLAAFTLVAVLVTEFVLLAPGISTAQWRLAGRLDAVYGATAGLLIAIGFARAVYGTKGWAYYAGNPFFWAKVSVFALIGLLSIPPTMALLKGRRTGALPSDVQLAGLRRWLHAEVALLPLLPVFAALMARGVGM